MVTIISHIVQYVILYDPSELCKQLLLLKVSRLIKDLSIIHYKIYSVLCKLSTESNHLGVIMGYVHLFVYNLFTTHKEIVSMNK